MLFRNKKKGRTSFLEIPAQVITIWGPGGNNTASFSFKLARELARHTQVLLVELPCLGIPRLGFAANLLERNKHVEAALTEFWYKEQFSWNYLNKVEANLAVLPICAFAKPDNPLVKRVELKTLKRFPAALVNGARQKGYGVIVFICQGQLIHPLTFFALRLAERIVMPVSDPSTIAFGSLNITKLVNSFEFPLNKFMVIAAEYCEMIKEVMWLQDEEHEVLPIQVISENLTELVNSFTVKASQAM